MSLSLERAEGGEERAGGGEQEGVMRLPAELSPWTGLPWALGGCMGVRQACRAQGLSVQTLACFLISLSVCRRPSPTTPTPAQVMSKQLG